LVHVRFLTERTIYLGNKVLCLSAPWRRANASSFSSLMDSSFGGELHLVAAEKTHHQREPA
jgi:hypothetical protein